jgi:hypothetical protein
MDAEIARMTEGLLEDSSVRSYGGQTVCIERPLALENLWRKAVLSMSSETHRRPDLLLRWRPDVEERLQPGDIELPAQNAD